MTLLKKKQKSLSFSHTHTLTLTHTYVCNCDDVLVGVRHTSQPGRLLAQCVDIIEQIYSGGSPDDKQLADEEMQFETFSFSGNKPCVMCLASERRPVHKEKEDERERRVCVFFFF